MLVVEKENLKVIEMYSGQSNHDEAQSKSVDVGKILAN